MDAKAFLIQKHGEHCHSLPVTSIIDLMNNFADHKYHEFEKKKEKFNSEMFIAHHNFEQIRNKLKEQKPPSAE